MCTKEDKSLLLNEIQILGFDYIDKLDDDFTPQGMNKFILSMKNNKATGCDGIPAEVWKILVTKAEETYILTKLFNMIRRLSKRMENCKNTTNL